jgi:hypothetical protein
MNRAPFRARFKALEAPPAIPALRSLRQEDQEPKTSLGYIERPWWRYFIFVYENRTMKLIEMVLRRGEKKRKNDGRGESNSDIL